MNCTHGQNQITLNVCKYHHNQFWRAKNRCSVQANLFINNMVVVFTLYKSAGQIGFFCDCHKCHLDAHCDKKV